MKIITITSHHEDITPQRNTICDRTDEPPRIKFRLKQYRCHLLYFRIDNCYFSFNNVFFWGDLCKSFLNLNLSMYLRWQNINVFHSSTLEQISIVDKIPTVHNYVQPPSHPSPINAHIHTLTNTITNKHLKLPSFIFELRTL